MFAPSPALGLVLLLAPLVHAGHAGAVWPGGVRRRCRLVEGRDAANAA